MTCLLKQNLHAGCLNAVIGSSGLQRTGLFFGVSDVSASLCRTSWIMCKSNWKPIQTSRAACDPRQCCGK